ncbi:MAG: UvrD-helicase domain-containing protein, partial [Pseudomonadota bacterium]
MSPDDSDAFEAARLSARAMAARPAPYLDGLNPAQLQAVEILDGPVLMLAGAGTGKTRALTARIAHLMSQGKARPNEILAVTFTNKAAREMRERLGRMMGEVVEGMPWLGTFHAICVKLLRRHAELIGRTIPDPQLEGGTRDLHLRSNFTILDTDDQNRLLKQLILAANMDEKRWPARQLGSIIDHWKNSAWTPDKVPAHEAQAFDGKGVALYREYQDRLLTLNAVDFGDLLMHVIHIFQAHDDVLEQYRRWFRYILVDEYQDTNVAQYLWLRLLAGGHRNICCVGDDDQSIYGWRGAEVGNILRFEKDFEGAEVIRLEQNYRSTPHILAAASGVIAGNKGRLGKTLWTEAGEGHRVRLMGLWDGDEEARWIGEEAEAMQSGTSRLARERYNPRLTSFDQELDRRAKTGLGPVDEQEYVRRSFETGEVYRDLKTHNLVLTLLKDDPKAANMLGAIKAYKVQKFSLDEMAILVRAAHQMRAFEDRFLTIGLPYRVIGGPRFYERLEIRDAMAYFRLVVSPDDDLAFERIVNTPKRGLGDKAQQTIQVMARSNGVSLVEGAKLCVRTKTIGGKGGKALGELVDGLDRWRAEMLDGRDHIHLAEEILDESGYTGFWQNEKTPEAPGRLENLKELVKALEGFENLQGFLEHVSLIMDNEGGSEEEPKITLMTLHAAKGLEFPVVFLPGWEDGLFPSQRSMDESGVKGLEEERRLAYVGITRAEEVCTISFAANRRVYGQWQSALPSRFIDELPEDHVEVLTPPGLYGGGFGATGMAAAQKSAMGGGVESTLQEAAAKADVYNSPGWRRLQQNAGHRVTRQPSEAKNLVIDATAVSAFAVADRVFHQKFGYGEVMAIEGDKLEVEFDKSGSKKIVGRFL